MAEPPKTITLCGVELQPDLKGATEDQLEYSAPGESLRILRRRRDNTYVWSGYARGHGVLMNSVSAEGANLTLVIQGLEDGVRESVRRFERLRNWALAGSKPTKPARFSITTRPGVSDREIDTLVQSFALQNVDTKYSKKTYTFTITADIPDNSDVLERLLESPLVDPKTYEELAV